MKKYQICLAKGHGISKLLVDLIAPDRERMWWLEEVIYKKIYIYKYVSAYI